MPSGSLYLCSIVLMAWMDISILGGNAVGGVLFFGAPSMYLWLLAVEVAKIEAKNGERP